jgi:hypothetical protein
MEPGRENSAKNPREKVVEVCADLGARAAGYWELDAAARQLIQISVAPGVGLDTEIGKEFTAATRAVPLSESSLGIVAAALTGQPAVSRVEELRADTGSWHWLRAFGANRSVAVPIRGSDGTIVGVLSVALRKETTDDDRSIIQRIRETAGV